MKLFLCAVLICLSISTECQCNPWLFLAATSNQKEYLYPDGTFGAITEWSYNGANYALSLIDSDDGYRVNETSINVIFLTTLDDLTTINTPTGVHLYFIAKENVGDDITLNPKVRIGAVTYSDTCSSFEVTDAYETYHCFLDSSPATSSEWTVDEINSLQIGLVHFGVSGDLAYCDKAWAVVEGSIE